MKRINDIFYSLQGEGHNTGRAAVFIRFAGCNLRCPFCDTEFDTYREMDDEQILAAISPYPARFVVLTGGEPTLQVDEAFVEQRHTPCPTEPRLADGIAEESWWRVEGGGWRVKGGG